MEEHDGYVVEKRVWDDRFGWSSWELFLTGLDRDEADTIAADLRDASRCEPERVQYRSAW